MPCSGTYICTRWGLGDLSIHQRRTDYGDSTNSYYQPPASLRSYPPGRPQDQGYTPPSFSDSLTLTNSHDPICACIANLISRTFDTQRCMITILANGLSYILAESTRTLSLHYPHTHAPGDQLWLGAGLAIPSHGGLCEHTVALVPPPMSSSQPLLEIPDLSQHPRYSAGGFVREWPYTRFYASSPLRTKAGVSIGTVCIMDDRPRPSGLTGEERVALSSFAEVVMDYLERKRESEDERRKQTTEIALGRFIAEGFLEENEEDDEEEGGPTRRKRDGMIERRDGRVWSVEELEQRSRQEARRRKRVEERRAAFQEERFAAMVRREREREQKHRDRQGREKEDSLRMRKDKYQYQRAQDGKAEEQDQPTAEVKGVETRPRVQSSDEAIYTGITPVELAMEEKPQLSQITQTYTQKMQLSEIGLDHIEGGYDSKNSQELTEAKVAMGMTFGDSNFRLPVVLSTTPWNSQASLVSPSSNSETSYFSTSTQATTVSPAALPHPPISSTIEDTFAPTELPKRMSNYEKTTSIESSFRSTFSRAAAWIHDAIDANVVFLDPDLEGFSDDPDNPHIDSDMQVPGVPTCTDMGTTAAATHISSPPDVESTARERRSEWLHQCTGVLAYASSTGGSLSLSHPGYRSAATSHGRHLQNLGFDMGALDEQTLAEITTENRTGGGGIIALGCEAHSSSELLEAEMPIHNRTKTEEVLPKFLPGVRSAIVVPLVAGEHSSGTMPAAAGAVFAVAVVWTCEATRTFCSEIEGRFVVGVARGIVAEVSRLNILNGTSTGPNPPPSSPTPGMRLSRVLVNFRDHPQPGSELQIRKSIAMPGWASFLYIYIMNFIH